MTTATLDLFSEVLEETASVNPGKSDAINQQVVSGINGLDYVPDFITLDEERKILEKLEETEWLGDLERRVQHFGYKYNYKTRRIDESLRVGDLPKWLIYFGERLARMGFFEERPDQVIVNEYLPGQGISAHIDCEPCFGDTVVSLSLGSGCTMDFTKANSADKLSLWLAPRSIVVLKSDARYCWRHAIPKRKKDEVDGRIEVRERRVSLTFRKVKM
jgi:alkylated DNA repair dioxygenase AlkB